MVLSYFQDLFRPLLKDCDDATSCEQNQKLLLLLDPKKLLKENMELKEKGYAIKELIVWQLSTFYLFCEFCEMWYSFLSVITLENNKIIRYELMEL